MSTPPARLHLAWLCLLLALLTLPWIYDLLQVVFQMIGVLSPQGTSPVP